MRSALITRLDGPSSVEVVEQPEPTPTSGQVVIDVAFAGVSYPDVLLTRGQYQIKPPLPFVPGSEIAGVVRSAPRDSGLTPGAAVMAFTGIGAFSDVVAVDPTMVFALPDTVGLDTAAALPMNAFTMHFALKRRAHLRAGQTVLVHGAAGGIGTTAISLAKAWGARVIGVVSDDAKAATALAAGADDVVSAAGFREAVSAATAGAGVDIVVDPVGGDRFTDSLRTLAPEGQLLVIGFTAGEIPTVKVNRLLLNNLSVVGVGWGAFWLRDPSYLAEQWRDLAPMVGDGTLNPSIGNVYPLDDVGTALAELDERRAAGKVLLRMR